MQNDKYRSMFSQKRKLEIYELYGLTAGSSEKLKSEALRLESNKVKERKARRSFLTKLANKNKAELQRMVDEQACSKVTIKPYRR